jgi:hypothetical protein
MKGATHVSSCFGLGFIMVEVAPLQGFWPFRGFHVLGSKEYELLPEVSKPPDANDMLIA